MVYYGVRNELRHSEGNHAVENGEENVPGRTRQTGMCHYGHYSQVREWVGDS